MERTVFKWLQCFRECWENPKTEQDQDASLSYAKTKTSVVCVSLYSVITKWSLGFGKSRFRQILTENLEIRKKMVPNLWTPEQKKMYLLGSFRKGQWIFSKGCHCRWNLDLWIRHRAEVSKQWLQKEKWAWWTCHLHNDNAQTHLHHYQWWPLPQLCLCQKKSTWWKHGNFMYKTCCWVHTLRKTNRYVVEPSTDTSFANLGKMAIQTFIGCSLQLDIERMHGMCDGIRGLVKHVQCFTSWEKCCPNGLVSASSKKLPRPQPFPRKRTCGAPWTTKCMLSFGIHT